MKIDIFRYAREAFTHVMTTRHVREKFLPTTQLRSIYVVALFLPTLAQLLFHGYRPVRQLFATPSVAPAPLRRGNARREHRLVPLLVTITFTRALLRFFTRCWLESRLVLEMKRDKICGFRLIRIDLRAVVPQFFLLRTPVRFVRRRLSKRPPYTRF